MRQPERNCSLLKAAAIPHALGEGHRALRAPASASVQSADSQTPGVKRGSGSLRLSRHWLPQLPALRAAPACLDDAGSTGGLAHCCKLPRLHALQTSRRSPPVVKPIDFRWETRGIEKGSYSCMPWRRKGLVLHTPGSEKERRDWCRMFAPPTRGCQRGTSRHAGLCVTPSEPCRQVPRFAPPYDRIPPSRLSRELLSKRVPTPS